jgi:hypothetical protein
VTGGGGGGVEEGGPFRGRLVVAVTGAPITGAHVMVSWERDYPNPVHWTQRFYDAQETTTDSDGRFEIPRRRRFFTVLVGEPRFGVFAPGYFAEGEEVVVPGGQLYVDETVLKMRFLRNAAERCRRRPGEPAAPRADVPLFMNAVQQYNLALTCAESSRGL